MSALGFESHTVAVKGGPAVLKGFSATTSTASTMITVTTCPGPQFIHIDDLATDDQAWFWDKAWQEGERRADELYNQDNLTTCETIDEVITLLRAKAK